MPATSSASTSASDFRVTSLADGASGDAGSERAEVATRAGAALGAAGVVGAALEARTVGDATHAEGADVRADLPGTAADAIAIQEAAITVS